MKHIPWILLFAIVLQACTMSPQVNASPISPTQMVELAMQTPKPTYTSTPFATLTHPPTLALTATITVTPSETPVPTPTVDVQAELIKQEIQEFYQALEKNGLKFAKEEGFVSKGEYGEIILTQSRVNQLGMKKFAIPSYKVDQQLLYTLGLGARGMYHLDQPGTKHYKVLDNNLTSLDPPFDEVLNFINDTEKLMPIKIRITDGTNVISSDSVTGLELRLVTKSEFKNILTKTPAEFPHILLDDLSKFEELGGFYFFENGNLAVIYYHEGDSHMNASPNQGDWSFERINKQAPKGSYIYSLLNTLSYAKIIIVSGEVGGRIDFPSQIDKDSWTYFQPYDMCNIADCSDLDHTVFGR